MGNRVKKIFADLGGGHHISIAPKPAKKKNKKLRRSNSANTRLGLSVILHADESNYEVAENNFFGFKVIIIFESSCFCWSTRNMTRLGHRGIFEKNCPIS